MTETAASDLAIDAEVVAAEPERHGDRSGSVLRRNLGALLGGQAVTWSMTLLWTLVVPRILGPSSLGLVVSAISISSVLSILIGLGTRNFLVREIVIDPERGPKLVGTAIVIRLCLAPLVAIAAVFYTRAVHDNTEASVVLYLATLMTIFTLLAEPMQAALQAQERMKYLAYADMINKTAQSLVGIAVVLVGLRAVGIMADMAAAAAVVIALTYRWLTQSTPVDCRTNRELLRDVFRGSLTYWAAGMFSMFYLWIDTILLSLLTKPKVVGWYGVTTNLFQTALFVAVLVTTAWMPRLVESFKQGNDNLMHAAQEPLGLVTRASVPMATLLGIFAPFLTTVLYGHAYDRAAPVMMILAACLPWMYTNIALYTVFVAMKRANLWTYVMIGAAIFNPALNLVLIPITQHHFHNGALGAAIALVITEVVMTLSVLALLRSTVLNRQTWRRLGATCLASAAAIGVTLLGDGLPDPVAPMIGTIVMLALGLRLGVLTESETATAKVWLGRARAQVARRG